MTKTKKRAKPLVGTWYAVQFDDGNWFGLQGDARSFARAQLWDRRSYAIGEGSDVAHSTGRRYRVVPCRVRPLTSKKRNAHRTR